MLSPCLLTVALVVVFCLRLDDLFGDSLKFSDISSITPFSVFGRLPDLGVSEDGAPCFLVCGDRDSIFVVEALSSLLLFVLEVIAISDIAM